MTFRIFGKPSFLLFDHCIDPSKTIEKDSEEHKTHLSDTMKKVLPKSGYNGLVLIFKAIFDMKEGLRTVLKKRNYNDRLCVILLISAFLLEMFTDNQWVNIFMYYRLKLKFRMEDFTTLMSLAGFVGLTGQYIFVPLFLNVLKFHDATISCLGNYNE